MLTLTIGVVSNRRDSRANSVLWVLNVACVVAAQRMARSQMATAILPFESNVGHCAMIMRVLASPGLGARESNPYTWLLYSRLACRVEDFSYSRAAWKSYEIVHFHWPETPLNSTSTEFRAKASVLRDLMLMEGLRSRGSKVFWTVHNLGAHEGRYPALEPWFWDCFTARLDAFIALTQTGLVAARNRFPRLRHIPGFVIPHGHYRDEYPARPANRLQTGSKLTILMRKSFFSSARYAPIKTF